MAEIVAREGTTVRRRAWCSRNLVFGSIAYSVLVGCGASSETCSSIERIIWQNRVIGLHHLAPRSAAYDLHQLPPPDDVDYR